MFCTIKSNSNAENYKEYVIEKVNEVYAIVKKFDGDFLVRNGEYQIFDGGTEKQDGFNEE